MTRLVVLTDEEIKRLARSAYSPPSVIPLALAAKLEAALEQPEGIGEEWRAVVGDKDGGDEDWGAFRESKEAAEEELARLLQDGDPPFDYGHLEHRYCTPWAALHRGDGER